MSKRSAHGTHVWVRTELVEAILHHQGTLPSGWKPSSTNSSSSSSSSGASRSNRRHARNGNGSAIISVTDWGWARATLSGTTSPHASPAKQNGKTNNNNSSSSNPFGAVKLRKTGGTNSSTSSQNDNHSNDSNSIKKADTPKLVTATIVIDDEEFAPPHLLFCPVSLTYDANDTSLVCMANSWWYAQDEPNNNNNNNNNNNKDSSSDVAADSSPVGSPPEDLTNLSHLHEPAVVFCLQRRYEQDKIYTYTGKVLLALNPFRPVDNVYGEEVMHQYWNMGYYNNNNNNNNNNHNSTAGGQQQQQQTLHRPPPHVYSVAEDAYRSLVRSLIQCTNTSNTDPHHHRKENRGGQDQSILVSGESGAGKTVTTKIVMKYLTTLSQQSDRSRLLGSGNVGINKSIEAQVLQSNPILESFGNARTVRNDNSSRFGKFIEIEFNASGSLTSASITTYLLEKVRLITQTPGERNYHIFYEILAGVSQRERQQLRIGNLTARDFKMTAASGTFDRRDGVGDRETYKDLRDALDTVGFSREEQFDLLTVACALLHASNLTFQENTPDASELDLSNLSLRCAVDLLGVSVIALNEACCRSAIEARGETLYKNLSIPQAKKAVEALIKATYQALFTYIARRINSFITVQENDVALTGSSRRGGGKDGRQPTASIGVLDIFGFESFEENSFEQLCINFCNEALQQQFNKFVFKQEQDDYKREGIEWSFIEFPDNQDVLDLIEKRRDGIISILDEQCRLQRCTDKTFARALYDKCSEHPRFYASNTQKVNLSFCIQHYAGLVEYSSCNFLEKNKDELPKETTDLLLGSNYKFIATLAQILSETASGVQSNQSAGSNARNLSRSKSIRNNSSSLLRESVGSQFSSQLRDLRIRIADTSPHYIRCLKPNDDLIPYNFQPLVIADQLRCAGVLEAIRVSRVGFPHRFSHEDFVELYSVLCRSELQRHRDLCEATDLCEMLISCLVPLVQSYLANAESNGEAGLIERDMGRNRTRFLGLQMGRSKVFIRPRTFEALEVLRSQKVEGAAITIQSATRMFLSTIRYEITQIATIIIQAAIRRFCAIRRCWRLRLFRRASTIQNAWRLFSARRRFFAAVIIANFCQTTYRGVVARKRCVLVLLDIRAATIQCSWRRSRSCSEKTFYKLRSAIVSLQTLHRRRKAMSVLKTLKAEARDLTCVAEERDKLREETRRLREELERAKQDAENRGKLSKEAEVKQLKSEVQKLREELEKAKQMAVSPTLSHADELGYLARECELKELQLKGLRKDLRQQYGFSPDSSSKDFEHFNSDGGQQQHSEPIQTIRVSPGRSSSTSMSLLDADNPDEGYVDNSFEALLAASQDDVISKSNTTTTMSLSYSMNTPDLRGEAFFLELRRLHDAVRSSDLDLVEEIIRQSREEPHVLINEGDEIGRTALHVAVLTSNLLMTQSLLDKGAIANAQDNDGETPLHLAESSSMTGLLLKDGRANPNIPNIDGICALHLAVQRRDLDSVRSLLLHNANVNSADNVRWFTPLHLIALPARASSEDVAEEGEVRIRIAELMSGGASSRYEPDLNYQDSEGNCPLHYGVQLVTPDAYDLIRIFLECGADAKVLNNRKQSALHLICHNNSLRKFDFYPESLQFILNHGADANQQSAAGCTALHLSLYHRDIDSAAELVANGAQLHPLWKKPKRWVSFWDDKGSSSVLALDMVKNERHLIRILSAVSRPQKWAPSRSWCMQCRITLGTFARALHCRHCGRFVCGDCAPRTLTPEFFPPEFEVDESAWVCVLCEKILASRKEFGISNKIPGTQEECSSTHLVSSFHDEPTTDSFLAEF